MKQAEINIFFGFLKALMFLAGICSFLFFFVALALLFINLVGAFFCVVFCVAFLYLFYEANKVRRQIVLLKREQKK
jgi:predicted membrane protein